MCFNHNLFVVSGLRFVRVSGRYAFSADGGAASLLLIQEFQEPHGVLLTNTEDREIH